MKKAIAVLFLIIVFAFPSFAKGTNFVTSDIPNDEKEELINNSNIQKIEDFDGLSGFSSFDVNENGDILLVRILGDFELLVFDKNFNFLYGFDTNIEANGGAEWNGDNIIFYLYRGDWSNEIDKNGKLLDIKHVDDISNSYLFDTEKVINGITYKAEKSFFLSSTYSKLTKIDSDGEETVIFDVSEENLKGNIFMFSCIAFFCTIVITVVSIYTYKSIRGRSETTKKERF